MPNPRWEQLTDILDNYSATNSSGDCVLITMMETDT